MTTKLIVWGREKGHFVVVVPLGEYDMDPGAGIFLSR